MTRIAAYLNTEAGATVSASTTPFHDLADFVALPRMAALRLSPDGSWLAAAVQTLSADRKKYLTSIWRIDAAGRPGPAADPVRRGRGQPALPARRVAAFHLPAAGSRPREAGPDGAPGDSAALWLLPAGGGEASGGGRAARRRHRRRE